MPAARRCCIRQRARSSPRPMRRLPASCESSRRIPSSLDWLVTRPSQCGGDPIRSCRRRRIADTAPARHRARPPRDRQRPGARHDCREPASRPRHHSPDRTVYLCFSTLSRYLRFCWCQIGKTVRVRIALWPDHPFGLCTLRNLFPTRDALTTPRSCRKRRPEDDNGRVNEHTTAHPRRRTGSGEAGGHGRQRPGPADHAGIRRTPTE
jgi:hypothetical protein